jgi:hypothetical protein
VAPNDVFPTKRLAREASSIASPVSEREGEGESATIRNLQRVLGDCCADPSGQDGVLTGRGVIKDYGLK